MNPGELLNPYFTQTQDWADFWGEVNSKGHFVHTIEVNGSTTFVYQYPWYFGQNFLYVPAGPILNTTSVQTTTSELSDFFTKIKALAKVTKSTFVKLDVAPSISNALNIHSHIGGLDFLNTLFSDQPPIVSARKRIMYVATSVLESGNLIIPSHHNREDTHFLKTFFNENAIFWKQVNSGHRSKTRKSLNQEWTWSENKTDENFEFFWKIYSQTSNRQDFVTQPKSYFKTLYSKPQSRIIVLCDQSAIPQAVWFGYSTEKTLIYLYGGNSEYSMNHFGQYLIHLVALKMARQENKLLYDLGGYDAKKGYGVFKERYKGEIIAFLGPYDIIFNIWKYNLTELFIKIRKLIAV